jgi:cytochrome c2
MIKKLYLKTLILSAFFIGLYSHAESMEETKKSTIKTAFFSIDKRDFRGGFSSKGKGGAMTVVGSHIIIATNEGDFFQISTETMGVVENFLPHLDNGRDKIGASKFYSYRESNGRVHDLLHFNDEFYVSYDLYITETDTIHFEISRFDKNNKIWTPVYKSLALDVPYFALGNGGKMIPLDDENILFSIGDYSLDRKNNLPSDFASQNPTLPWGKVLKLHVGSGSNSVFSMGHRNIQGLTVLKNGAIIASEHAPRGGDELNAIVEGENYGWPFVSFGTEYNSYKLIDSVPYEEFIDQDAKDQILNNRKIKYSPPFYSFVPSIAPTDIIQIDDVSPLWDSNLLLASLKAMSLYHIKVDMDKTTALQRKGSVVFVEPIYIGSRIRDIEENGGIIWLLLDDGTISTIEPTSSLTPVEKNIDGLTSCITCHNAEPTQGSVAPTFKGLFNRQIATSNFNKYSDGLKLLKSKNPNMRWTETNLIAYLMDPQSFAPGTTMPNMGLTEGGAKCVIARIQALEEYDGEPYECVRDRIENRIRRGIKNRVLPFFSEIMKMDD